MTTDWAKLLDETIPMGDVIKAEIAKASEGGTDAVFEAVKVLNCAMVWREMGPKERAEFLAGLVTRPTNNLPNEGLTFAEHFARRKAERSASK